MKLSCDVQHFKRALKRNRFSLSELYYRGKNPCQAKCFYMQTKKAYITYTPTSCLDAYFVSKEAENNGYKFTKIEDLIDDAKKI